MSRHYSVSTVDFWWHLLVSSPLYPLQLVCLSVALIYFVAPSSVTDWRSIALLSLVGLLLKGNEVLTKRWRNNWVPPIDGAWTGAEKHSQLVVITGGALCPKVIQGMDIFPYSFVQHLYRGKWYRRRDGAAVCRSRHPSRSAGHAGAHFYQT